MFRPIHFVAAATLAGAAVVASAEPSAVLVAEMLPMDAQVEVVHPAAKSLDAFEGRAILIEFFAHW